MKNKIFVIAEVGINHNGSIILAKKLIDAAVNVGADAVKFQTFDTESEMSIDTKKLVYQKVKINNNLSLYSYTKKLEFNKKNFQILFNYARRKKINIFSSPSDITSVKLLKSLNQKIWKIASNLIDDYPLLKLIGSFKNQVILSTGMSNIKEIKNALNILIQNGTSLNNITLLQCHTDYPTNISDLNLNVVKTLKNKFKTKVGLSDHSNSLIAPSIACMLGATIIEKHITLNKNYKGPDHKASLNTNEFKEMVLNIRNLEIMLGTEKKIPTKIETNNLKSTRKSIYINKSLKEGEIIKENHLTTKRPANGISPMKWKEIIGTKSKKNFNKGDLLEI